MNQIDRQRIANAERAQATAEARCQYWARIATERAQREGWRRMVGTLGGRYGTTLAAVTGVALGIALALGR